MSPTNGNSAHRRCHRAFFDWYRAPTKLCHAHAMGSVLAQKQTTPYRCQFKPQPTA